MAAADAPTTGEPVTLEDALSIARAENPELAFAQQQLNVALGEVQKASYLSQFNLQSDDDFLYRARSNRANSQDWRISILQEFEIFGQRGLRKESASIGLRRSEADFRDTLRLVLAAVKLTFFDSLRARRQTELLSQLDVLDSRLKNAAQTRLEAGEIGQIDYNLAVVRQGRTHTAMLIGQQQYEIQRLALGRLLGGKAGSAPVPAADLKTPEQSLVLEQLLSRAKSNRPDLRARQLEVARLDVEASLNRRLNWPDPVFGVTGGHEVDTEHFVGPVFGFSVPLFNRRTGEATIIEAQQRQAKLQYKITELDIERQVRDAYTRYQTAAENLRIYDKEIVKPARESFALLERAFIENKIDLLRLSVAERDAFDAQAAYFDAWFDLRAAEVALELATGAVS